MAVDYVIQFPCEVRNRVSEEDLLGMLKSRNRAEFAIAQVRKISPEMSAQEIAGKYKLGVIEARPDGKTVQKELFINDVLNRAAPLTELSVSCRSCSANMGGTTFGCVGAINYPISQATEEWLIGILPEDVSAPSLSLLMKFMEDFKIDGAPVDSQRGRREVYQLTRPVVRKWGGLFSRKTISSSQVMHLLLHMGSMEPVQTVLITQLLGLADGKLPKSKVDGGSANAGIAQFRSFMQAMIFAANSKSRLFIDS